MDHSLGRNRVSLIVLTGVLLIIFHRLLLGEVFFWGLPSLQFYPWREYAFDLLRNGQLPYWNSLNGAGAPLLANYQTALLYPLNWFGFFFPLAWSMSITAVVHLFIAGWGMWAFTGLLGFPELGQGISSLSFALCGYLVARLGTYPIIFTAAWIPWLMWAVLKVMQNSHRKHIGWLATFFALQLLAGHAQTAWYSTLLVGMFSAYWGFSHRIKWSRLAMVACALILGAGIASVQLLPTVELLAQSQRSSGVDYEKTMNFSYAPARMLNLLSPNFFGTPAIGTYSTEGAFFEDAVYFGFIPLISALTALLTWGWGTIRRAVRPTYFYSVPFWLVIVIIAFVLALGKYSPVFPFLYNNIPTFSMFQAPVRWHIWTVFGLAVLAGMGVGMWTRGYRVLFGTRLAIAAGIGAALLALVAPQFLPADLTQNKALAPLTLAVVVTGILGVLAGGLTLLQPESQHSPRYRWWVLAVLLVVAGDLVYASWGLNPTVPASFYDPVRNQEITTSRGYWPEKIETDLKFEEGGYLEFDDYRVTLERQAEYRLSNLPNLNMMDDIPLLNNFEPLLIGSFKAYTTLIERFPGQRDTLLEAAGVGYEFNALGEMKRLDNDGQRARFVDAACWHNNPDDVQKALVDNWKPTEVVHLLGAGECLTNPANEQVTNTVDAVSDKVNSVTLKTTVNHEGWLVLADSYYPGWTAYIDNMPADIIQANLMFRALRVPAGAQEVRFEYQFSWFWPSVLMSVVSLFIVFVLFRSKETSLLKHL